MSCFSHLECSRCGKILDCDRAWNLCPDCSKPLLARYDIQEAAKSINLDNLDNRSNSMWRYHEMLPVKDPRFVLSLGEGYTPLFHAKPLGKTLGIDGLYIKDEGCNPTCSFKARGLSMAVSKAAEFGIEKLSLPSAGNAAGAMSAYAALAGISSSVFMPKDVPKPFISECRALGAEVTLVDGLITDCGRIAAEQAKEHGRFDCSTLKEPYRIEGKKTMAYELVEQFSGHLPDVIIYPTGGGTGLIGMWKAFDEMEGLGWINSDRPRMVAVQSIGCAPIVRAYQTGQEFAEPFENASTIADGLRVPAAIGDFLILSALRESRGIAVSVSDDDMIKAANEIGARQGIFAAPEGGATLAAAEQLLSDDWIKSGETVVLFNTGSGHKYAHLWEE